MVDPLEENYLLLLQEEARRHVRLLGPSTLAPWSIRRALLTPNKHTSRFTLEIAALRALYKPPVCHGGRRKRGPAARPKQNVILAGEDFAGVSCDRGWAQLMNAHADDGVSFCAGGKCRSLLCVDCR